MAIDVKFKLDDIVTAKRKTKILNDIRKEFGKHGPQGAKEAILDDVSRGISPVRGKGKYDKYSDSYKTAIRKGRYTRYAKKISPVNLLLSEKLHKALEVFTKGKTSYGFKMVSRWRHKLFDIHNTKGAGKSKVIRRMLPTKKNELFNRKIMMAIQTELKKAIAIIAKRIS